MKSVVLTARIGRLTTMSQHQKRVCFDVTVCVFGRLVHEMSSGIENKLPLQCDISAWVSAEKFVNKC